MSDIKIGSKVEVLFFEEGIADAPCEYIGAVGEVFSLTQPASEEAWNVGVRFDKRILGWNEWDFKPKQLKIIEEVK